MFGRSRRSSGLSVTQARQQFTPPSGLITLTQPTRSAPFVYDPSRMPAVSHDRVVHATKGVDLTKSKGVDLTKTHMAAANALEHVDLHGIRLEVILMVDGSISMEGLYLNNSVQAMLVRTLGFVLNVDGDGTIPAISYGHGISKPVNITMHNFMDAPRLLAPNYGGTPMTEGFEAALALAQQSGKLTLIINITDGAPNQPLTMKNAVIKSSGEPIMLKNLAVDNVPFLEELDDMPSCVEIRKDDKDNPIRHNGYLVLDPNPNGVRWIDNVDSKGIDPHTATDDEFAAALADEIKDCLEVMARTRVLTGYPGCTPQF